MCSVVQCCTGEQSRSWAKVNPKELLRAGACDQKEEGKK